MNKLWITLAVLQVALVALCVVFYLAATKAQAVDATSAWNSFAAEYGFDTTAEAALNATFEDAFNGAPVAFDSKFAGICDAVEGVCGGPLQPPNGDDDMRATLRDWN